MATQTSPRGGSTEIHELLRHLAEAWNNGDAASFAEQFTVDAEFISWRGIRDTGRAAIEASHRVLFDGPLKDARMDRSMSSSVDIKYLTPDVALLIADGAKPANSPIALVITLTAVRRDGRWRFASFQNTQKTAQPGR